MSEWETLREAAEIMDREGYPGAGNARRLSAVLQFWPGRDERDKALAKALYEAWADERVGVAKWQSLDYLRVRQWSRVAQAARSHIATEGFAPGARPGDPEPLTVEPTFGSVVRDVKGDLWDRHFDGWARASNHVQVPWPALVRGYGPLTLASTPEEAS